MGEEKQFKVSEQTSQKVAQILSEMSLKSDLVAPDARSAWLSQWGVLTQDLLEKLMLVVYTFDPGVKDVDLTYVAPKFTLSFVISLSWFAFMFRKDRIFEEIKSFCTEFLPRFDVNVEFVKNKKNRHKLKFAISEE